MLLFQDKPIHNTINACTRCNRSSQRVSAQIDLPRSDVLLVFKNKYVRNKLCDKYPSITVVDCGGKKEKIKEPHIKHCRGSVYKALQMVKPKVVLLFGMSAVKSLIMDKYNNDSGSANTIDRWRGFTIPYHDFNCWLCPVVSPDYVETSKNPMDSFWYKMDIHNALKKVNTQLPDNPQKDQYIQIVNKKGAVDYLQYILCEKPITAFDYETNSLKPYRKESKIVSCAISDSGSRSVSFEFKDVTLINLFMQYLKDKQIKKIAANMAFEDIWSKIKLGVSTKGWVFDTMLGQHIIDNREAICGLKFMMCVRYGVFHYNTKVEQYLKNSDEDKQEFGSHCLNQIDKIPMQDLLLYNGYDSLFERMLYFDMRKEIGG